MKYFLLFQKIKLLHFEKRYYSPTLGRWITCDPLGLEDGPNLYAYVHNSPLIHFDAHGLFTWGEAWESSQYFMWGVFEGAGYHFTQMASSFAMRDLSHPTWEPESLMQQNFQTPQGLDYLEKQLLPFTYEARRLDSEVTDQNLMRARGRALGEQAITLGGLFSAFSLGKNFWYSNGRTQEAAQLSVQELSRDYLFSGKPCIKETAQTLGGRHRFKPDFRAEGAHSVFRRDPLNGKVTHYETFRSQTNHYDPKPWESVIRFDGAGSDPHFNKVIRQKIIAPHMHDPLCPGRIRPALPWEIPK